MNLSTEVQQLLRKYRYGLIWLVSFSALALTSSFDRCALMLGLLSAWFYLSKDRELCNQILRDPDLPKYIQTVTLALLLWQMHDNSFCFYGLALGIGSLRPIVNKATVLWPASKRLENLSSLTLAVVDSKLILVTGLLLAFHFSVISCEVLLEMVPGLPFLAPLIFIPVVFFAAACMRGLLQESTRGNGLSRLIAQLSKIFWHDVIFFGFVSVCFATIAWISFAPNGLGEQVGGWVTASAADANFFDDAPGTMSTRRPTSPIDGSLPDPTNFDEILGNQPSGLLASQVPSLQWVEMGEVCDSPVSMAVLTKLFLTGLFSILFLPHIIKFSCLLTFLARKTASRSWKSLLEDCLEVLRRPTKELVMKESVPWLHNAAVTFWWLSGCYGILFFLVAACPGPLGAAMINWIDASLCDARIGYISNQGFSIVHYPQLRLYVAALFAMMGTVPLAVTGCVFLPTFKSKTLTLTADGMLLSRGPYVQLHWRPFRLWCDFKTVSIVRHNKKTTGEKRNLLIKFFSGGSVHLKLSQLSRQDLYVLLSTIDEQSERCVFAKEVVELRRELAQQDKGKRLPEETQFRGLPAEQFRSTVFSPLTPGENIPNSNIRVIRQLASKQLSAVYLVRLADSQLAVAKQFSFPNTTQAHERLFASFQREYQLLRDLDHPFISKVLEVLRDGNTGYIILEHSKGRDLRTVVEEDGPRNQESTIALAKKICQVMSYLHAQEAPVVHRDLTPDNLVIDDEANLRLIDFGAAHQFLEGITGTLIGKQCYVAPEQLRGAASTGSDIYSFGCTLHYLLTGLEPIALSQNDPALHVSVVPGLRKIIMDCTAFDEEMRPESFDLILSRLDEITMTMPISKKQSAPFICSDQGITLTAKASREKEPVSRLQKQRVV